MPANLPHDPVCGLQVHPGDVDSWVEYEGTQYYFCCPECRRVFEESPEEYAGKERREPEAPPQEGDTRSTQHPSRA